MKIIKRFKTKLLVTTAIAAATIIAAPAAEARPAIYKNGDIALKFNTRVQLQYYTTRTPGNSTRDDLRFRRLRPTISGSLTKNISTVLELDTGDSGGSYDINFKNFYLKYTGLKDIDIIVGNIGFNFSRELLTSSKKQQVAERTFVGDHNYGVPDKAPGLHVKGGLMGKKITYGLSAVFSSLDPDDDKLDLDTPLNEDSDFNRGVAYGARIDFHPQGYLPFSQGDFARDFKTTIGLGAFTWREDKDHRSYTTASLDNGASDAFDPKQDKTDIESIKGFEISGAVRGHGVSVDAQYNRFEVDAVDDTYSSGIFKGGDTTLEALAIEGGYMLIPSRLEIVAAYQEMDTDSYARSWTRRSIGANYFINKHNTKLQATFRQGRDLDGVKDKDNDELFIQAQYIF